MGLSWLPEFCHFLNGSVAVLKWMARMGCLEMLYQLSHI